MTKETLHKIREADEDHINLICEVMKLHPGEGTTIGWSNYVGGMIDTGEWLIDKLLDVRTIDLEHFLNYKLEEQRKTKEQKERWGKMTLQEFYNERKQLHGDYLKPELKRLLKLE